MVTISLATLKPLLLAGAVSTACLTSTATAQDWVQSPVNQHWYALTPTCSWAEAAATAEDWGGHLATVRSAEENDWLYQQFCQDSLGGSWIGLNDRETNGVFAWHSGETATFQAWDNANVLNTSLEEDSVHLQGAQHEERFRGRWNDLPTDGGWLGGLPGIVEVTQQPDTDGDGLTDRLEERWGCIVGQADTDEDGLTDGVEVWSFDGVLAIRPLRPYHAGPKRLDPTVADTDGDGLSDGVEYKLFMAEMFSSRLIMHSLHPLDADSDEDGLLDGQEDLNGNGTVDPGETDPTRSDTDQDGLLDGLELGVTERHPATQIEAFRPDLDPSTTTDPTKIDTDGSGLNDGQEDFNQDGLVQLGETDPTLAADDRLQVSLEAIGEQGELILTVSGLRAGSHIHLLAAELRPEAQGDFKTSGNPLALGLGVPLELPGTPIELYRGVAKTETIQLRLRPQISAQRLHLQLVEDYAYGWNRTSTSLTWP